MSFFVRELHVNYFVLEREFNYIVRNLQQQKNWWVQSISSSLLGLYVQLTSLLFYFCHLSVEATQYHGNQWQWGVILVKNLICILFIGVIQFIIFPGSLLYYQVDSVHCKLYSMFIRHTSLILSERVEQKGVLHETLLKQLCL